MTQQGLVFLTGAARSGTSLLDKLLGAHPALSVLSQPLPRLYPALKREYLAQIDTLSDLEDAFPLNDLFDAHHRPPEAFTAFLKTTQVTPDWARNMLAEMQGFSGQLSRPDAPLASLIPDGPCPVVSFIHHYLRAASPDPNAAIIGSKDIVAEEFIPTYLAGGARVIVILRDPRDLVASALTGRGPEFAGAGLPLLFLLRQWRKSVAFALAHTGDPGFLWLRYEDLVRAPNAALGRIATHLGTDPFPADIPQQTLTDSAGQPWHSNASNHSAAAISTASIGAAQTLLPTALTGAIETLCAPELACLGYAPGASMEFNALHDLKEPCAHPRASLSHYVWSPAALVPEQERLDALAQRRYVPRLHLFETAFDALGAGTPPS